MKTGACEGGVPAWNGPTLWGSIVVGGGHNGLVAASVIAREQPEVRAAGGVLVLERSGVIGGAARTEHPFEKAPGVGCSTGAYLLGPMPPEVIERTGIRPRLIPRRPHGFLRLDDGRPCAFGLGDRGLVNVSDADRRALDALDAAVGAMRDDLAPAWLRPAVTFEHSAELVRDVAPPGAPAGPIASRTGVRELYLALGREPIGVWLARFGFQDEQLTASVATDAFVGSSCGPNDAGVGMNFLAHNMLRLPPGDAPPSSHSDTAPLGAWQLVEGGMGEITRLLAESVQNAGGTVRTNMRVERVEVDGPPHTVVLADGTRLRARRVILATDPRTACGLVQRDNGRFDPVRTRVEHLHEAGTSIKINLALSNLPDVIGSDELLGGPHAALSGTVHVLPERNPMAAFKRASAAARRGELPDPDDVMVDVYTHTAVDPSLCPQGDAGPGGARHSMSLFVQWFPASVTQQEAESWAESLLRSRPMRRLFGGKDQTGGLAGLVVDRLVLPPAGIEARFGIAGGHIHHLDNRHAWTDRFQAATPVEGLHLACAGCHPAGSVIGAAGLIASSP